MKTFAIWKKLEKYPMGKWLFTKIVCFKAPYFGSIKPLIIEFNDHGCKIQMKNRRSLHNHLGTMHAIAMCNLCELTLGMTMESTVPEGMRWIPKGMTVQYLRKGETDLIASCRIENPAGIKAGDIQVPVSVRDTQNVEIMTAEIKVYISARK